MGKGDERENDGDNKKSRGERDEDDVVGGTKADTKVDTIGLLGGEQMFQWSKGQTRVNTTAVVVINELFNIDNHCCP
ncbi:hypothetical protein J1N35_021696 [Gossypium stocksii]|uniref:Uncharacterized protein n=1 Tax=Gossypium stocksii TaxID=47602 RepID=A0A9D3VEP6_9ROSI|nr:hypothetical protein J1N35_021696 [Gossypium stocksii]